MGAPPALDLPVGSGSPGRSKSDLQVGTELLLKVVVVGGSEIRIVAFHTHHMPIDR